jgi:hypothetical protein
VISESAQIAGATSCSFLCDVNVEHIRAHTFAFIRASPYEREGGVCSSHRLRRDKESKILQLVDIFGISTFKNELDELSSSYLVHKRAGCLEYEEEGARAGWEHGKWCELGFPYKEHGQNVG